MKKVITAAMSIAMIASAGAGAAGTFHADKAEAAAPAAYSSHSNYHNAYNNFSFGQSVKDLAEYATVTSVIGQDLNGRIVENSSYKRTVQYTNAYGQPQYKSIFMKKQNTVKVIDFRGGQLYYGALKAETPQAPDQDVVKPDTPATDGISSLPEYHKLASVVSLDGLTPAIAEDNYNKRVIVLKGANGHGEFKSIFIKRTNMLKVIDLDGGQIFYGSIR
ncbi:hypothetical protein [Bhargavaea cecembensis]|uniref:hypothetical protein n=1 Tax=Bhargavaea cecembensis TaxID=394098 RepID=UPI00069357BE|nr:hypothetical protein [Bhargavaea cecembensis]